MSKSRPSKDKIKKAKRGRGAYNGYLSKLTWNHCNIVKPPKYRHYFTKKELAIAVDRDPQTLYEYEKDGKIPKPATIDLGKRKGIRLYSPQQVKEIENLIANFEPKSPGTLASRGYIKRKGKWFKPDENWKEDREV